MSEDRTYQGHHRLWHVLAPDGTGPAKLGEPREPQLWFDRRCFEREEVLVAALPSLGLDRVPRVRGMSGSSADGRRRRLVIQDFIEGRTLAEVSPFGTTVPERHLRQIIERFEQLAAVSMERVERAGLERCCKEEHRAKNYDSHRFLRSLIDFTRTDVHLAWRETYPRLFASLRIPADALDENSTLSHDAARLTRRPFCLLHGDLHRTNLIVQDADDRLWTIDWELAMVGDPVYDLATHLHLMGYPPAQEAEVVQRWRETVPKILYGADAGMDADLLLYRRYKRAQSLFTDVVRHAHRVGAASAGERTAQLRATGEAVSALLRRAADDLRIGDPLSPREVSAAYARAISAAPVPPSAGGGTADAGATRRGGRGVASPQGRSGSG